MLYNAFDYIENSLLYALESTDKIIRTLYLLSTFYIDV